MPRLALSATLTQVLQPRRVGLTKLPRRPLLGRCATGLIEHELMRAHRLLMPPPPRARVIYYRPACARARCPVEARQAALRRAPQAVVEQKLITVNMLILKIPRRKRPRRRRCRRPTIELDAHAIDEAQVGQDKALALMGEMFRLPR